jgi:hypothetical protein
LDEWRHAGTEVNGGAWTSLCGSGTGNSLTGAASHESRLPRLLAGASVVEAHRLGRGGHGKWAGHGKEVVRWRQVRQTGPSGEYGAEEAAGDEASCGTSAGTGGGEAEWGGRMGTTMLGRKRRSEQRGAWTERADRVAGQEVRARVSGGRRPSVRTS